MTTFNDSQIEAMVLQDAGATAEQAFAAVIAFPGKVGAEKIAAKRAELDEAVSVAEQARYEASPAGRREAGAAALAAAQDREQSIEEGRELLRLDGHDASKWDGDQVLFASGIAVKPGHLMGQQERDSALEELASNWNHLPDPERRAAAKELQESPDLVAAYAARTYGKESS